MIIVMFTIPMEKTKIIMMVQFPWIIIILVLSMGIVKIKELKISQDFSNNVFFQT